jgi:hypothetical protein
MKAILLSLAIVSGSILAVSTSANACAADDVSCIGNQARCLAAGNAYCGQ